LFFKPNYSVDVSDDGKSKKVTPSVSFPYGTTPLTVNDDQQPLTTFTLHDDDQTLQVLASGQQQVVWQHFAVQKAEGEEGGLGLMSAMDDSDSSEPKVFTRDISNPVVVSDKADFVVLGQGASWAYSLTKQNDIHVFKISDNQPTLYQSLKADLQGANITAVTPLQGEVSLLIGDSNGTISQWFLVRDQHSVEDKFHLQKIRSFKLGNTAITAIVPETKRKGFVAGDIKGNIGYFYTTSERTLGIHNAANSAINTLAISARSEGVFVQSANSASFWSLHSEHPDISMSSAWGKVWYESYPEPSYTWQSTSGNVDFEGKLSLMPLTFGTLKAAFYAMLLAAPLAIFGAMYTAVFMSPSLRTKVKPAIELMQALPTVILGFFSRFMVSTSY